MTIINKKGFTFLMKNFAGHTLKRDFIGKKKEEILKEVFNQRNTLWFSWLKFEDAAFWMQ